MKLSIWLVMGLLALIPFSAGAQDQAPAATPSANAAETDLDLAELGKILAEQVALIAQYQRDVDLLLENAEAAQVRFDEMIASYEKLIKATGSDGVAVPQIEKFITLYESFAAEVAASDDPQVRALADDFTAQVASANDLKGKFVEEAAKGYAQLEKMRNMRELAVRLYQLGQGERALEAFQGQLDVLTAANERVRTAMEDAESRGVQIDTGPSVQ